MLTIIHRYVLWELVRSFVLSFAALVGVMLIGAIYKPLRSGISLPDLMRFLPYVLPYLYAWVIPAALLAACVMTYGRLSADNELTAICTSGVPLRYVCYPALLFALVLTSVAIPLNDWLIPYCSLLKERELRALFIKEPFRISMLGGQVTTKIGGYMIYFESAQGDVLYNVVVIEPRERERAPAPKPAKGAKRKATQPAQDKDESAEVNVYRAQRAHYSVDAGNRKIRIVLHDAQCIIVTPEKTARVWFELTADEQVKDILMFEAEVSFEKRNQQTTRQLLLGARELEAELRALPAKASRHRLLRDLARTLTDVRFREALAFSTLALCFVGVPLGIWMRRQSRLASFAAAVLVFLLLYGMIAGGEGLAVDGRLSPRVALWTPDILTGSVGLGMLLHLFRR